MEIWKVIPAFSTLSWNRIAEGRFISLSPLSFTFRAFNRCRKNSTFHSAGIESSNSMRFSWTGGCILDSEKPSFGGAKFPMMPIIHLGKCIFCECTELQKSEVNGSNWSIVLLEWKVCKFFWRTCLLRLYPFLLAGFHWSTATLFKLVSKNLNRRIEAVWTTRDDF